MPGFAIEEGSELLPRPLRCGMVGRVHVQHAACSNLNRDEYVQNLECCCNCSEEVAGDNCVGVVSYKRTPSLSNGWPRRSAPFHVLANRSGIHENAELERQFVRNASLAPTRILCRHRADKDAQILR